ncbi:carboxypeptidase regulatory-like domain-containing protein [Fibrobacterota bacterium]
MSSRIIINTAVIAFFMALPCLCLESGKLQAEEDAFAELENKLTLRLFNALNGDPLAGAQVMIKGQGRFSSDQEGRVKISIPVDGAYRVTVEKPGFITSVFSMEIMAGTLNLNRFSLSPEMDVSFIRIVLDWGKKPKDLDAHFVKQGEYHISFRDKKNYRDGIAVLDRDDKNGQGPETITVAIVDDKAEYEYYVHDFTNKKRPEEKQLSDSRACVKVYGQGKLLSVYKVPKDVKGNLWKVFTIVKGDIQAVNRVEKLSR